MFLIHGHIPGTFLLTTTCHVFQEHSMFLIHGHIPGTFLLTATCHVFQEHFMFLIRGHTYSRSIPFCS